MNNAEIKQIVIDTIANISCVDKGDIKDDSNLKDDLGMDSLDFVEGLMALEKEVNTVISDDKAEGVKTVKDLVELVIHCKNG